MKKLTILFLILVGLLLFGIGILVKPTMFTSKTMPNIIDLTHQTSIHIIPREIIMTGSIFTISGVIGLAVLGFVSARESKQSNQKSN